MNRYRITLTHDSGSVRIATTASSIASAVEQVLKAEGAPERAIRKVERL